MIARYRQFLNDLRREGYDVFVIPGLPGVMPRGMAFTVRDGAGLRDSINIFGSTNHPLWMFVLAHEVGHIMSGHTRRRTSQALWQVEYEADAWALRFIRQRQPYVADLAERAAKEHIRQYLQPMIDMGIWHHVDLPSARWAGCQIPPLPADIEEDLAWRSPKTRPNEEHDEEQAF